MELAFTSPVEEYKVDAFDVLNFKLVREKDDLSDSESFPPDMTHQVFGSSEKIFGYKDLDITIAYTAGSLSTFLDIKFSQKIPTELTNGVEADDLVKAIGDIHDHQLSLTKSDFFRAFDDEELNFRPFGTLKTGYTIAKGGKSREFCVFHVDSKCPDMPDFTEYLKRMETFLIYFVDESSFISVDDNWNFYILYEKYTSLSSPNKRFAFVGYTTIYNFFAFPEHTRPRISQFIILPPFQRMGHATRLLETVYDDLIAVERVVDITVEKPSDEFQRVRDFLDCKRCLELTECVEMLKSNLVFRNGQVNTNGTFVDATNPKRRRTSAIIPSNSPETRFVKAAQTKLKICQKQARRVFDILRLYSLPRGDKVALDAYKDALLTRTRIVYCRLNASSICADSPEVTFMQQILDEQYQHEIQEQVDALMTVYNKVVEKLDALNSSKLHS